MSTFGSGNLVHGDGTGITSTTAVVFTASGNDRRLDLTSGGGTTGKVGIHDSAVFIGSISNVDVNLFSNNTNRFVVKNDGQLLPSSIHNNGGNGNSSNQALSSGTVTYTYAASSGTNLDSPGSITSSLKWMRVGNVFMIGGVISNVDAASAFADTAFSMDYSSGTAFPSVTECNGSGAQYASGGASKATVYVYTPAGPTTRLSFEFLATVATSQPLHFSAICTVN